MLKLTNIVADKIDKNIEQTIYITHCNVIEEAKALEKLLRDAGIKNKIEIYYYDLVSGAHIGPGSIAIFYLARKGQAK